MLGKIMVLEEARARLSHKPLWDLIVVDAPATGHGLAFLKVPLVATKAVPVGPIAANARRVLELRARFARTALLVVAIPEEMAVVEGLQFQRLAEQELAITPSAFVLNGCHERRFDDGGRGRGAAAHRRGRGRASSPRACRCSRRCAPRAGRSAGAS